MSFPLALHRCSKTLCIFRCAWRGASPAQDATCKMQHATHASLVAGARRHGGAVGHRRELSDPGIRAWLAGAALRASALTPIARRYTRESKSRVEMTYVLGRPTMKMKPMLCDETEKPLARIPGASFAALSSKKSRSTRDTREVSGASTRRSRSLAVLLFSSLFLFSVFRQGAAPHPTFPTSEATGGRPPPSPADPEIKAAREREVTRRTLASHANLPANVH